MKKSDAYHRGTLLAEIIKPTDASWNEIGDRIHTLRRTLGAALNQTMTELHPHALSEIEIRRSGGKPTKAQTAWQGRAEPLLRKHWNDQLSRAPASDAARLARQQKARTPKASKAKSRAKSGVTKPIRLPDPSAYLPIKETLTAETVDNILSRFHGDHLRDLIIMKASTPSFKSDEAFFARSRHVELSGTAWQARLNFPFWASGKKGTELVIAPTGRGDRALYDHLVADQARRPRVVELEQAIKRAKTERKAAEEAKDEKAEQAARDKIDGLRAELENMNVYKLGRVGIQYDERKHKLYALISYTYITAMSRRQGQSAAIVYGIDVHMHAITEKDTDWFRIWGSDIIAKRRQFQAERKSRQRSMPNFGRGSHGHGKKRRNLPITKLRRKEKNFIASRIRNIGAAFGEYCEKRQVVTVYAFDMSGIRDSFERRTEGEAHAEVKRLIHNWPYGEQTKWIKRNLEKRGIEYVEVERSSVDPLSCPLCRHADAKNLVEAPGDIIETITVNDKLFQRKSKWHRFKCQKCGLMVPREAADAARLLVSQGKEHTLTQTQRDVSAKTRKKVQKIEVNYESERSSEDGSQPRAVRGKNRKSS